MYSYLLPPCGRHSSKVGAYNTLCSSWSVLTSLLLSIIAFDFLLGDLTLLSVLISTRKPKSLRLLLWEFPPSITSLLLLLSRPECRCPSASLSPGATLKIRPTAPHPLSSPAISALSNAATP